MNPQAEALNLSLRENNKSVFNLLSKKGQHIFFPKKGILGQSADAKGTKINATIGAAIEDDGTPMRLESIASKIDMDPSKAFPYAPSFGRPDIRKKWLEMIVEKNPRLKGQTLSLPIVTNALTHGISMVGYLFVNPGDEVIIPNLFWGNYNLTLAQAYDAKLTQFDLFNKNAFNLEGFEAKLNEGGVGKKIVILNFPNNPSGYTPTVSEMTEIVAIMKRSAEKGNEIVAVTDDAYFGLVFEDGVEEQSIFSYLSDLHENILAVKVDGATKEDYVWGFRVGFITYGVKGGTPELYDALASKTAGAVRGNISNASNLSQSLLLEAFESDEYAAQKVQKFNIMKARYNVVKEVIKNPKYEEVFTPLPFNSGYFMCIDLKEGLDGEEIRALLIKEYGIGVINLNNILRIAFSAVSVSQIEELFEGIYKACKASE